MLTRIRENAHSRPMLLLLFAIAMAFVFSLTISPATATATFPDRPPHCIDYDPECPYDNCCIPCGLCSHCNYVPAPPPPPPPVVCSNCGYDPSRCCTTCSEYPCECCTNCGEYPCGCCSECGESPCICTVAPAERTPPSPSTTATPTATAATERDPNEGPRTGDDSNNWFAQIAGIALLTAIAAMAGLIFTGRKGSLSKNKVYHIRS